MPKNNQKCFIAGSFHLVMQRLPALSRSKGQALVEFTLVFILLLVVAWIPADFGLAFYSGQLAQNASREGARIAAADPNLVNTSCTMPCSSAPAGSALQATAARIPPALMTNVQINLTLAATPACNRQVTVAVSGNYNFFFYQILRLLRLQAPSTSTITRSTAMRWEHQEACLGS